MDLLPWNSFLLNFSGFKTEVNDSKRANFIITSLFFIRVFLLTLLSIAVCVAIFFMKDIGLKLICLIISFYIACNVAMFIMVSPNIAPFIRLLSRVSQQLNEKERLNIRRQDKTRVVVLMMSLSITQIAGLSYTLVNAEEVSFLMNKMFFGRWEVTFVSGLMTFLCCTMMMILCTFYESALAVCQAYADNILQQILKLSSRTMSDQSQAFYQTKRLLSSYIILVNNVNNKLGVIPFTVFAILFSTIVMAISFESLGSYMSLGMAIASFAGTIVIIIMSIMQIIIKSNKSRKKIVQAFVVAQELSSSILVGERSLPVVEARRSLTTFLCQQSIPHVTAMSMFDIEPSIVLSFLNAVISFTVMFVTTVLQITKETTKN